ncbi:hypothetical protein [Pseudomonas amygdali]|uniref:hypothetical protein n=1 Tax=Pseudomonas amygdali TaxID=47877 RepID=UPI0005CB008C|nr:hypothetical protein [Pseudomonas amygdali]KWS77152.1 hypothetical protein AL051_08045 [Pseudomonas amygdali pv. dendropanacis]
MNGRLGPSGFHPHGYGLVGLRAPLAAFLDPPVKADFSSGGYHSLLGLMRAAKIIKDNNGYRPHGHVAD